MGKIVTKSVDMNANILYLKHEIVADTSKTQARIEFRNMAYGTITAVKFEAKGYNAFGDVIQIAGKPTFDIVAQDLNIAPKKYAKLDSVLPSKDIRKLDLKLKQVCYANGKIVNVQPEEIVTYEIEDIDENWEKLNQQEREARTVLKRRLDEAVCFSKPYGRNWICICGYLNRNTDTICKCCGCREVEMLEEYSEKRVTEKVEEKRRKAAAEQAKREAEQIKFEAEQKRQREEQERREAEERAKAAKRGKIIAGVVGAVTICGVAGYFVNEKVIVPNNRYNHAIESINAGQYEDAIGELKELGEYKDASKKIDEERKAILEGKYTAACELLEQKSYDEAIRSFNAILEYKDSGNKILEAQNCKKQEKYDTAMALIKQGKYDEAIETLEALGDFDGANEQITEANYQKACALINERQYDEAIQAFENLGEYKDSSELLEQCEQKLKESDVLNIMPLIRLGDNSNSVKEKLGEPDDVIYGSSYRNPESRDCTFLYKEKYRLAGYIGTLHLKFNKNDASGQFVNDDNGWLLKEYYWSLSEEILTKTSYEEIKEYLLNTLKELVSVEENYKNKKRIHWEESGYTLTCYDYNKDSIICLSMEK